MGVGLVIKNQARMWPHMVKKDVLPTRKACEQAAQIPREQTADTLYRHTAPYFQLLSGQVAAPSLGLS